MEFPESPDEGVYPQRWDNLGHQCSTFNVRVASAPITTPTPTPATPASIPLACTQANNAMKLHGIENHNYQDFHHFPATVLLAYCFFRYAAAYRLVSIYVDPNKSTLNSYRSTSSQFQPKYFAHHFSDGRRVDRLSLWEPIFVLHITTSLGTELELEK